ncbi:hypothetical protein BFJ70_g16467 [Fusarium oxysporum]|nr:hypothetical protein BFJ70_g16467 [Fusarium oxysporum]
MKRSLKVRDLDKNIPYLGHHFFNAAGVPMFDLDQVNHFHCLPCLDRRWV